MYIYICIIHIFQYIYICNGHIPNTHMSNFIFFCCLVARSLWVEAMQALTEAAHASCLFFFCLTSIVIPWSYWLHKYMLEWVAVFPFLLSFLFYLVAPILPSAARPHRALCIHTGGRERQKERERQREREKERGRALFCVERKREGEHSFVCKFPHKHTQNTKFNMYKYTTHNHNKVCYLRTARRHEQLFPVSTSY